jgi:DNA-binding response OmpR family regulator
MPTDMPQPLILIVEDEPLIGIWVQDSLEAEGFETQVVESGEKALAALNDNSAISALVTDIRLEGGISGWEVAQAARAKRPELPIVYMSGDSAPDHRARGVPDSVMMQKPFVAAQIVTALTTLLNALPPKEI